MVPLLSILRLFSLTSVDFEDIVSNDNTALMKHEYSNKNHISKCSVLRSHGVSSQGSYKSH